MQASDYLEEKIADWIAGKAFPTPPGELKVALSEANPGEEGLGFKEVTGSGYERQTVVLSAPVTNEATGSVTSNNGALVFSGLDAVTATHIAIFDDSGSNLLVYGELSAVRAVAMGDSISIPATAITLALKGKMSKYLGEAIINWLRGTDMPTAPKSVQLELSKANPRRDSSGFAPPSGSDNYAARTITMTVPSFSQAGTTFANSSEIVFGPAQTHAWGTISHVALYTAGGNMLVYGELGTPITVGLGEGIGFAAGALALRVR